MSVRIHRHVERLPDGAAFSLPTEGLGQTFHWRDGMSSLEFSASGCAWSSEGSGGFRDAFAGRSLLVEQSHENAACEAAAAGLPMLLHAIPFGAASFGASDAVWAGWPAGRTWLPERVLVRTPKGAAYLVTQTAESHGASVTPLVGPNRTERARDLGRAAFTARLEAARAAIREGVFRKVVVARSETVRSAMPFDPLLQLAALKARAPYSVAFAWLLGPERAWLGATPEVLARSTAGRLQTSAIAGTALASLDPAGERLLADPKSREEHGLVVDAMRAALEPHVHALEVEGQPRVLRSERLVHLETSMGGMLRGSAEFLTACESLHPTPALGGSPQAPALAWLARHEGLHRGYYGAPIGWSAPNGDGVLAVGIRSVLLAAGEAVLFAGAGIVLDSDPEAEWLETAQKLELGRTTLRTSSEKTIESFLGAAVDAPKIGATP